MRDALLSALLAAYALVGAEVEAWLDRHKMDRLSLAFLCAFTAVLALLAVALVIHFGRLAC
ncbi:hypothetical protein [Bradyrhizobium sp. SZCCHNR2012]|uniref:hypothetical protein n=1 Tax=Bradyrhizobium sp. SZCCHNR2012 TaxID=3057377 RepID=UPI0028F0EE2D|nr:hypothetical protein [Bradyrhizobium sp. SZCCHNR2012]